MSADAPSLAKPATSSHGELISTSWLVLGIAWFIWAGLIGQLRLEWSVNDQYRYGFAVPILTLYLVIHRKIEGARVQQDSPSGNGRQILGGITLLAALLLPLRLIQEASPDWRLLSWAMALTVIALSLGLVCYRNGAETARRLALPMAFILTAVPWPSAWETRITQTLMQVGVSIAASVLPWLGIPASAHGNILDIGNSLIGINEACSGIRSLQTTLMVSLFFGELFRFGVLRRLVLLLAAEGLALLINIGRTLTLSWLCARLGNEVMEQWHDRIGITAMLISMVGVVGLAHWLRLGSSTRSSPPGSASLVIPQRPWPRIFALALGAWLVIVPAAIEVWYRAHEASPQREIAWNVHFPTQAPGYQDQPISATTRAILQYSEGHNAMWRDADGHAWSVFSFQWAPGRTAASRARAHRPEICLPARGCLLETDFGMRVYTVETIPLPFRRYLFRASGKQVWVWYCLVDDAREGAPIFSDSELTVPNRLRGVLRGERNRGQRELEVILSRVDSQADAETAFATLLSQLVEAKK